MKKQSSFRFRRLLPAAVFALISFVSLDATNAQFKTKPPQPGNGWINTPSGIRKSLRSNLSIKIRRETTKAALTRVVMGQATATPLGLDSTLNATSPSRVSVAFSEDDGKVARLIVPQSLRGTALLLHGLGSPRLLKFGFRSLDVLARDFVKLANLTNRSVFSLELIGVRRGMPVSLPLEIRVDLTRSQIRIEY